MKLLKDLGTKRVRVEFERFGLFECPKCGLHIERRYFNGLRNKTCGCTLHGKVKTRLYAIWTGMKSRCQNKNREKYIDYGGRGISICDEWNEFKPFYNWAVKNGYDDSLQIDRIDNGGDYRPCNCRFATPTQNSQNKRTTKLNWDKVSSIRHISKTGTTTRKELSEIYGVSETHIGQIIRNESWVV